MQKSEDELPGAEPAYRALADFERWAAIGASAPVFADRVAAAGSAADAYRRLDGQVPTRPDARLDGAERRVETEDWWESLAKAYHWQQLTAQAYRAELDPEPQQWAAERLEQACRDEATAGRLALVQRRLAGEALVLRWSLGTL